MAMAAGWSPRSSFTFCGAQSVCKGGIRAISVSKAHAPELSTFSYRLIPSSQADGGFNCANVFLIHVWEIPGKKRCLHFKDLEWE